MKKLYLPLIILLLLVLEGVALEFLPENLIMENLLIIPHWVMIFLVLTTMFYDRENTFYAILYGVLFGLMIDVVYTSVLGIYMFIYGIVAYVISGLTKVLHTNLLVALLLGLVGVGLADIGVYIIYSFIGITDFAWGEYIRLRLIPTLAANLLFLLVFYPFIKGKLEKWSEEQLSSNSTTL